MDRSLRALAVSALLVPLLLFSGCAGGGTLHRTGATRIGTGYDVAVAGGYAYVTGNDGVAIFSVDNPRRPRSVSQVAGGFTGGVLVQDGLLFVASERALTIADVTDPRVPVRLGTFRSSGVGLDVCVEGNLAYLAGTWGLEIVDVSDPSRPVMIGSLSNLGEARSVVLRESILYLASPNAGVRVIDVSDPSQPRLLRTVRDTGSAWDLHLHEDLLFVGCHGNGARILSLDYPLEPQMLSRIVEDDGGEAQGVWSDGEKLVIADNYGVELFDVSDPGSPAQIGRYSYRRGALHDLDVEGDYVYVAGGTEGLIILEIRLEDAD